MLKSFLCRSPRKVQGEALPPKHRQSILIRFGMLLLAVACGSNSLQAVAPVKKKKASRLAAARSVPTRNVAMSIASTRAGARPKARKILSGPWRVPNYADSTDGDYIDGEDLAVRRAAVDALGPLNGTIVVSDPNTGRILTIVNQKLALQGGYQPCSTIK